ESSETLFGMYAAQEEQSGVESQAMSRRSQRASMINSSDALCYAGKYLPGDRSCFASEFASQDLLLTLPADQNDLVPRLNPLKVSHVHHNLIHRDPSQEPASAPIDQHIRFPTRQMAVKAVAVSHAECCH